MKNKKQQVAIIVNCYPLGTSTILLNIIEMIITRNLNLDIIIDCSSNNSSPVPRELNNKVNVITPYKQRYFLQRIIHKLEKITKIRLLQYYEYYFYKNTGLYNLYKEFPDWVRFALWAKKIINKKRYDFVFFASYPALFSIAKTKINYYSIYLNLELLDEDDTPTEYGNKSLLRSFEHSQIPKINRVIAMSPHRKDIFVKLTGIIPDLVKVLPIIPMSNLRKRKSSYFRDLFNISKDKFIVLYSGSIGTWAQLVEIIQSVKSWPNNCVLVLHSGNSSFETGYGRALRKARENLPVYFSSDYLDYYMLCDAIASADIGIAYYKELDSNFSEILFSSNKIAEYLCSGLPVICSPQESLKQFIDVNKIGHAIPVEQIPTALNKIISNIDNYRCAVKNCVEKHFDFNKWFEQSMGDIIPPPHTHSFLNKSVVKQEIWDISYNDVILQRHHNDSLTEFLCNYIPKQISEKKDLFEIGCFPGRFLPLFSELGYIPHGIDLTPRLHELPFWLKNQNMNCGEFIKDDFMEHIFTRKYFLVCSFGFIEHFKNYREVFQKHLDMVESGGYVCVTYPNFKGFIQYLLHKIFDSENLSNHYLPSMNINTYIKICKNNNYNIIFSGYIGKFDFWRGNEPLSHLMSFFYKIIYKLFPLLKLLPVNRFCSPYTAIIAQKQ